MIDQDNPMQGDDVPEKEEEIGANEADLLSAEALREEYERVRKAAEEERKRREEAERRAAEAERLAQQQLVEKSRVESLISKQAYEAIDREAAAIEAQIEKKLELGEYSEVAKLQRRLAQLEAQKLRYEEAARSPAPTAAPQTPANDPLANFSPRQRVWINDHPEVLSDQQLFREIHKAHFRALSEDYAVDSPEYFDVLEQAYQNYFSAARSKERATEGKASAAPTPPSVPAIRGDNSMRSQSPRASNSIRLTPEEREAADFLFPDEPVEGGIDPVTRRRIYSRYELYAQGKVKKADRMRELSGKLNGWR